MGRRANKEGSVYQRKKDGRWVASSTLDTGKGIWRCCHPYVEEKKYNDESGQGPGS